MGKLFISTVQSGMGSVDDLVKPTPPLLELPAGEPKTGTILASTAVDCIAHHAPVGL